jgi:carboxypeptidase C (cathepsin A)
LPDADRRVVIERLMKFTGLSRKFLSENNLRIPMGRFNKELLRHAKRTVGRLDSRIKGVDRDTGGSRYEYDPSMAAIDGPYSAAFKDYVRTELKYESEIQYRTLGGVGRWKYPEGRYVNVAETLRRAMSKNRHLKVLVTSGYYDLATPYFATDYTVRHLGLDKSLRANITVRYYEAGHMMYIHAPSRTKMKSDVAAFFRAAVAAGTPAR